MLPHSSGISNLGMNILPHYTRSSHKVAEGEADEACQTPRKNLFREKDVRGHEPIKT